MTSYIKRLPAVFQTVTEKKFFDATFDQVFSKKDSDLLSGYIGRRNPGDYNPITDFYLPEPSKNRTWWQLEATAYARTADSTKTNIFFYDDLLERIEYYGGNTLNQDRLFESKYYSFGPPIDYDMFTNYENYYWVEQGLPTISISGVMGVDIIGKASYTTPGLADPSEFTLSTGMTILLLDDPLYPEPVVVENMGGCDGIQLVPIFPGFTVGTIFQFLPWDGMLELSTGEIIQNILWDGTTWDIQAVRGHGDYITIERGAADRNAWSRTNKWFHIDAINQSVNITGGAFPPNATRALRSIIQFVANLDLYKSGTQFRNEITFGFNNNQFGNPIEFTDIQGEQLNDVNSTYSIGMAAGDFIVFFNDTGVFDFWDAALWDSPMDAWDAGIGTFNNFIFEVQVLGTGEINLVPYTSFLTPVLEGDIVFATEDAPYDGAQRGSTWYYSGGMWSQAFNDKVSVNQAPLFQLYDHNGIPLDDSSTYPDSTFFGSKIFSYKENTTPGATNDPVLGFPIVYTSLGQASDIIFQNNLIVDRYTYSEQRLPINGYYYYKTSTSPVLYNNWNMYDICDCDDIIPTPPVNCVNVSKQRVIDKYTVGYGTEYQFRVSVEPYGYPTAPDIIVSVNASEVKNSVDQVNGYTLSVINGYVYVNLSAYLTNLLLTPQAVAPVVEIQTYTHGLLDPAATGYSEIPQQLEANPTQLEVGEISASNLVEQFSSIIQNQIGFEGTSFGGKNNYRDSRKNRSLGQYILQNVSPALKSMLVSSEDDLDFIKGVRFSSDEYTKFKNKYLTTALQLINQQFSPVAVFNNSVIISYWVGEILKILNVSKEFSNAFAYSYMAASGTPFASELYSGPGNGLVTLTNYVDLDNPKNVMYIYNVTNPNSEELLLDGIDYTITSTNLSIDVQLNLGVAPVDLYIALYQEPLPTYIPSTPTKVGAYQTYVPRIELDTTFVTPTNVIIGHDGSKTIAYGDYRDILLLELEKRIYNSLQSRYRYEYSAPVRVEDVKTGYYRKTRYTRAEYLDITQSYLNKWSTKNRANYRTNNWPDASVDASVVPSFVPGVGNIWKLYNYRDAITLSPSTSYTPAYELILSAAGQTVINTTVSTSPTSAGQTYLLIFNNGVMQMEGAALEFIVTGANQITFNTPLLLSDNIAVYSFDADTVPSYETQVATAGQTLVNSANLPDLAFINGVMQSEGATLAYTITGPTQITFNVPLVLSDDIVLVSFTSSVTPFYESQLAIAAQTIVNTVIDTTTLYGLVFVNGILQLDGAALSYTVTGTNQITFNIPLSSGDDISMYFYEPGITPPGVQSDLPGNWKGIFDYYYDTYNPDTRPWEMLGFGEEPSWWRFEYGTPVINIAGQEVWTATASGNNNMWADLELGLIRQGPSAIFDPITLIVQPQITWARPGLSLIIPVDSAGEVISVMVLFNVVFSGNYYEPFDHFDDDWVYGDGAPVEQAWISTSGYKFSLQEFMYLMKPGPYGEQMWDTLGTELSPGQLTIPGIAGPVKSNTNWQYVQNYTFSSDDEFSEWFRPKNKDQIVHAENIDGVIAVRFGYQTWISDRILFLNKTVSTVFGQKIRTLDVNLANKLAGFTNKDTTNTYIEAITPCATNSSLILPSTNFEVMLHKSPPVKTYSYSGVIIRSLTDGTFVVYGYDVLNSEFLILDRSVNKLIDVTIGGTPAEFRYFEPGATYNPGDIVRYNGVYFLSNVTQVVQKFVASGWTKLPGLPTTGGISVSYKPQSKETITRVPYGTILKTPQDVFDMLIGWGAYLESQGWKFDEVNQDTNILEDWLSSSKQYLFWLNTAWAPDAAIQLSPLANKATLVVDRGYPDDVETLSNGVYSILDKSGIAIAPNNTTTDREDQLISVSPLNLSSGGIYFLQINVSETEHVLIFDNVTSFNDTIYSPLLRARQQRLRFYGFRSNGWYGKMEAPGYLIIDDQLVPNYDTIVEAMRYYYDPDVTIDNPSLEDLGRHLIGYESKSYLDNLQISNDVQYLFYQGAIRQKGTVQAFDKLFRSTKVQSSDAIEVFEEWALKLGDFGNTVEQVSIEFRLIPEQNTGEVIVARLNFVPSDIGIIRQIRVLNAQNRYTTVPGVSIPLPDATPDVAWSDYDSLSGYSIGSVVRYDNSFGYPVYYTSNAGQSAPAGIFNPVLWDILLETRIAKAYIVLDSTGRISRVDMVDPGYGYLTAPNITIDSTEPHELDKLYAVWQGQIVKDETLDNIVNIDIDQEDIWLVRPTDPTVSLEFPVTNNIDYPMPNAGYVNFNDVTYTSFNATQTYANWGSDAFNPTESDTIWVAKNFTEDWNVYKLVNAVSAPYLANTWRVQEDDTGNLLLLADLGVTFLPQLWNSTTGKRTDFGNLIVLQQSTLGVVPQENNHTYAFVPYITEDYNAPGIYTDPDTLVDYNAYSLTDLDGLPITSADVGDYADLNTMLLYKTMRFITPPVAPNLPLYVGIENFIWVDNADNKWAVFKVKGVPGFWDMSVWDPVNSSLVDIWGFEAGWDITGPLFLNPYRVQEPLISTSLFKSVSVYETLSRNEIVQMPVYDPFKYILPGPAKQNISYISYLDPARYNVTDETRLYDENITFGKRQVGQLWWDTSTTRYTYYEQPIALDGSETELDNLVYRRDHWAQLFPGSAIEIYEWVSSPVPPAEYTGSGVPRSTESYVVITVSNRFTNITEINYYFWVLGSTNKPNVINRTMAATDVARLLQSPKSQGFVFFAPIQQTATNNSYMFYNAQDILAYKGDNVQIEYRISERDDQEHTQWALFREGDPASLITAQFWNKMVDSLCGYTKVLSASAEFTNSIIVANYLPWDIYGWDVAPWDDATTLTSPEYGVILPVPDPMLALGQKYGIEYRPRQGMFVNLLPARKVFVQAANALLQYIPVRDDTPSWNVNVSTSVYWEYTNWYKVGYENVVPTVVYSTLALANTAMLSGELYVGQIVQVTNGTVDGRYVLYAVVKVNPNVPALSLDQVAIQNSAIKLLDTVYTAVNKYGLSTELRELLNAFRTQVMVDENIVDQNELYFAMLNYVMSEQKNPDWVFKSSYIYIKENNVPLVQSSIYAPDNIDDVISYIKDSKPYHTQIRDYTSTHTTSDIAIGTASDSYKHQITLKFGPDFAGEEIGVDGNIITPQGGWDTFAWDTEWDAPVNMAEIPNQFVSRNAVLPFYNPGISNWPGFDESTIQVPLTFFDSSKIGLSALFPYTFDFNSVNLDNPQTFVTPNNIIAIQTSAGILYYGQDYYVEYNDDMTYTVYFYNDPGTPDPVAFVWIDGGQLLSFTKYAPRNETANVVGIDDLVVIADTKLVANDVSLIVGPPWAPATVAPYVGWGDTWDGMNQPEIAAALIAEGGTDQVSWDTPLVPILLDYTISFRDNTSVLYGSSFYRNAEVFSGTLLFDLPAPTADTYNIDVITVYVDPVTHPLSTDILPNPGVEAGVIWINGERIEYRNKQLILPNTWELRLIYRGTMDTAPTEHLAMIPSLADPMVLVPNPVWVEKFNYMPAGSYVDVWNALNSNPDPLSIITVDEYSNIISTPLGGLWYALTQESEFLKDEQGTGIP